MPALFDFDDVVVQRGATMVLDHVTVSIPDGGGITCILGPSGSGKSTLLRLCNVLVAPTVGRVRFRGVDLATVDVLTHRRSVGMVFQRPTVFPGTVRDNLLVADPDLDDATLADVLERADVPVALLDRDADSLSGGEAQRVCLARTLVAGPDVLLLDEPTSALDPDATRNLEARARAVASGTMPLLWVTHDFEQAERVADRRIVIVDGRVASDDEMREFLDRDRDISDIMRPPESQGPSGVER